MSAASAVLSPCCCPPAHGGHKGLPGMILTSCFITMLLGRVTGLGTEYKKGVAAAPGLGSAAARSDAVHTPGSRWPR